MSQVIAPAYWCVKIFLDAFVPPSKNEWERKYRHWAAKKRYRLMVASLINAQLDATRRDERGLLESSAEARTPVRLTFTIYRRRLLDDTNNYIEPIKDVLTARHKDGIGWIADDAPGLCKTLTNQVKSEREATEISIEPWSEA